MSAEALSAYEQRVVDAIAEHGWFCVNVLEDDAGPGFAYSVGLSETLGTPELIVFGLKPEMMHAMLWAAFRQLRDGREVKDSDRLPDLIEGFDCIVRNVHPTNIVPDFFNSALWYQGHRGGTDRDGQLSAMQIVWPGAEDGLFPWDPKSNPFVGACQPPLYLPSGRCH